MAVGCKRLIMADMNFWMGKESNMNEKLAIMAEEIISYADGSFHLDYPDEYHELTLEDQAKVDELVYEQIGNCDLCGWNFNYENLETVDGHGELCWACASNVDEEDESDED
jgi:hypothetical protein